jgi:signal transduction histidine kinase
VSVVRPEQQHRSDAISRVLLQLEEGGPRSHPIRELLAWVFHASPHGWALIKKGRIAATNPTFDELNQPAPPKWCWTRVSPVGVRRRGAASAERFESLRDLVISQAIAVAAPMAPACAPPRFSRGDQVIECLVAESEERERGDVTLVMVRDVTRLARAEAELAAARERLVEDASFRAMGELAAGVGHDLTNALAALKLRLGILVKQDRAAGVDFDNVKAIGRIAAQAQALASKFTAMARPAVGEAVLIDLRDVLDAAITVVGTGLRTNAHGRLVNIRIDTQLRRLPRVHGHPEDLQRVLVNLLLNARDAMPGGGTVTIRGMTSGRSAVVYVEDEGSGISKAHLRHVFDMFFTTKGPHGSGIGLAVAKNVMESIGGSISARNRRGGGACFELRFPVRNA